MQEPLASTILAGLYLCSSPLTLRAAKWKQDIRVKTQRVLSRLQLLFCWLRGVFGHLLVFGGQFSVRFLGSSQRLDKDFTMSDRLSGRSEVFHAYDTSSELQPRLKRNHSRRAVATETDSEEAGWR